VHKAAGMKSLAVVSLGLLWTAGGCLDTTATVVSSDEADEAGQTSEAEQASVSDADSDFETVVARRCGGGDDGSKNRLPNNVPVRDATGTYTTVSTQGYIDLDNAFFQNLGGNGRRCVSCHVPTAGWTITPSQLRATFEETDGGAWEDGLGLSAVFRTNDGSNSPRADVSTKAKRRQAYSMLLDKGLVRIGLAVPANAEFELVAVDDPYHFASASELSLFRRPLPIANLKFDSTVMWDGREVIAGAPVQQMLLNQSNDAVVGHAMAPSISQAQRQSIVNFELSLASAQISDDQAGSLYAGGAKGGPEAIHAQEFYIGINDNFGDSKTHQAFNAIVFNLFDAWASPSGAYDRNYAVNEARRSIARGQALFNTRRINISGVSGINDEAAFGKPANVAGTCTTCHDTPNGGNHSVVAPLNIGLVDASRRTADMPLYTLKNKTTGQIVKVTDPGRAMISGKWAHIGRFKGPMLRNLAPRAPYFHNGFAADLAAVVDFYDERFNAKFTKQEKADLVAFLRSL